MKDLFKKLHQGKTLPDDLEKEIMKSFDTLKLIADITDLFTYKFGKSQIDMHLELDELVRIPDKKNQNPDDGNKNNSHIA
ncbi:MAG: hypothetical protein NW226_00665 [Microscillaceae bacterium]|nr:hypothetical protein [Microscillaceae bacterium]